MLGTKQYMAPNLHDNDTTYDEKCDVFSLGMVLLECELRRYPFDKDEFKKFKGNPKLRAELIVKALKDVHIEFLTPMLEVDPQTRKQLAYAMFPHERQEHRKTIFSQSLTRRTPTNIGPKNSNVITTQEIKFGLITYECELILGHGSFSTFFQMSKGELIAVTHIFNKFIF